jgi:hypothetical protein
MSKMLSERSRNILATSSFVAVICLCVGMYVWLSHVSGLRGKSLQNETGNQYYPQTCDMCGAKWKVMPLDPNAKIPPTVEWCFRDGNMCGDGFEILIETEKTGETPELKQKWLRHCLSCKGCRCAFFKPDEWHKITDSIESKLPNMPDYLADARPMTNAELSQDTIADWLPTGSMIICTWVDGTPDKRFKKDDDNRWASFELVNEKWVRGSAVDDVTVDETIRKCNAIFIR